MRCLTKLIGDTQCDTYWSPGIKSDTKIIKINKCGRQSQLRLSAYLFINKRRVCQVEIQSAGVWYFTYFHIFISFIIYLILEKVSKCLTKQSIFKPQPHYYARTEIIVAIGFSIPRASSCAIGNSIFYFCHLAIFICLTNMILKFLYLTF